MAKFYGTVDGMSKTQATRRGSESSGIKASAQSWDGSVIFGLDYNSDGELIVKVRCDDGSSSELGRAKEFKFEDFKSLIARS